jgi:UDPglucose--hexose-1-phosphate uridylyltransferase
MEFSAVSKETVMLNPLKDMAERRVPSEIRTDPLTGRTARICHFMKLKWEKPDFERMVAGTEKYCPFCDERIFKITPHFDPELIPEGRLQAGDMVLFPNLAPYDALGAVATMGSRHYIPMTEISSERIVGALQLALTFFNRVNDADHPEGVYHIVNWNYMPPAGSSLIHPHLQVFSSSSAPNLMREELSAAADYMKRAKRNFWDDLVAVEKDNGQSVPRTHRPHRLADGVYAHGRCRRRAGGCRRCRIDAWAHHGRPFRHRRRTHAHHARVRRHGHLQLQHELFHRRCRRRSCPLPPALFSPRTFFNQSLGTPDIGALRNLFNETLCMAFPEEINTLLKPAFD